MTGAELVELRKHYGLSQARLGKLLGKGRTAISLWEREYGCRPPVWLRLWFLGFDYERATIGSSFNPRKELLEQRAQ